MHINIYIYVTYVFISYYYIYIYISSFHQIVKRQKTLISSACLDETPSSWTTVLTRRHGRGVRLAFRRDPSRTVGLLGPGQRARSVEDSVQETSTLYSWTLSPLCFFLFFTIYKGFTTKTLKVKPLAEDARTGKKTNTDWDLGESRIEGEAREHMGLPLGARE